MRSLWCEDCKNANDGNDDNGYRLMIFVVNRETMGDDAEIVRHMVVKSGEVGCPRKSDKYSTNNVLEEDVVMKSLNSP